MDKTSIPVPSSLAALNLTLDFDSDAPSPPPRPAASKPTSTASSQRKRIHRDRNRRESNYTLPPTTRKSLLSHLRSTNTKTSSTITTTLNQSLTTTLHAHCTGTTKPTSKPKPNPKSRSRPRPKPKPEAAAAAANDSRQPGADYQSRIHALSLELLRSGAVEADFGAVMDEILRRSLGGIGIVGDDIDPGDGSSEEKEKEKIHPARCEDGDGDETGLASEEGVSASDPILHEPTIVLSSRSYGPDGLPDVGIPSPVVEEGVALMREAVGRVVEIVVEDELLDEEEGDE